MVEDLRTRDLLPAVLGACAALVALSTLWKGVCVDATRNFRTTCYSDVLELFTSRGVARDFFPYVDAEIVNGAVANGFEYPVLTGVFIWLTSLVSGESRTSFLLASAVLLLPFALLTAWQLHRMAGARALYWAAAPSLVLYALHNWDLLAVAAATAGLYLWWSGRSTWAAVLFGVGVCLKVYPGLFLAPLVLDRLVRRDVGGAVLASAAGLGTVAAVNLPFVLVDRAGWETTFVFQEARAADTSSNSVWFWVYDGFTTAQLNRLVPVLVLLALAVALAVGLWRWRREGAYPVVQVCAAALVAFLVLNKVASPQYVLWLLPFFALLRVRWGWWAAFLVTDLLVYVGVFRWFAALGGVGDVELYERMLVTGVWTKSAVLVLLYVVFLTAQPTQRPEVKVSTSSAMSGAEAAT